MLRSLRILTTVMAVSVILAACHNIVENRRESELISGNGTEQASQAGEWMAGNIQTPEGDRSAAVGITAEELFQSRTLYIGNASGTGNLIKMIKSYFGIREASTMELQTTAPPYGLMLHFQKEPDRLAMQKASAVLIGLIDNCYSVSWDYPADGDGNLESCYVSGTLAGQMLSEERYIKEYAESVDSVTRMLALTERISEPLQPKVRAASLDEAVSEAILEYNRSAYSENESSGEGHLILETEEKDDQVTVYALTMYGSYQFQDGNFVKDSGSGVIPAVITLNENADGSLWWKWYQKPMDGGDYKDSIEMLFPESLWEDCISPSAEQKEDLEDQERRYAADYLKSIGREAEIGNYRDFSHPLLTEEGVSVEVSNKLSECSRDYPDSPAAYAPNWIGNVERLEDGKRYQYACAYDAEKQEILYSKTECDTGQIVDQIVFDAVTGERKAEETRIEEMKAEETKIKETKAEETKIKETKIKEMKVEEIKAKETKTETEA